MKINYENVKDISQEAYDELKIYDVSGSSGSVADDGVLDDFEIQMADGLPALIQNLARFCVGIVRKSADEFEIAVVWDSQCVPVEPAPIKTSNITPNGKVYPGVIIDIPGGEFEMGSLNGQDDERNSEGKTVRVTMSGFKLAKTEVTVGQYKAYLAAIGDPVYLKLPDYQYNKNGDNYPIVGLDFKEKMEFATYYGGTLPTAAETEYASKGQSHNDPFGTPIDKAIIWNNGAITTAEVCGANDERANSFGICDLAGNVWETTSDEYESDFYSKMSTTDPANPLTGGAFDSIEYRGGSFVNDQGDARAANRFYGYGVYRFNHDGFRVAWPQDSNEKTKPSKP